MEITFKKCKTEFFGHYFRPVHHKAWPAMSTLTKFEANCKLWIQVPGSSFCEFLQMMIDNAPNTSSFIEIAMILHDLFCL